MSKHLIIFEYLSLSFFLCEREIKLPLLRLVGVKLDGICNTQNCSG